MNTTNTIPVTTQKIYDDLKSLKNRGIEIGVPEVEITVEKGEVKAKVEFVIKNLK